MSFSFRIFIGLFLVIGFGAYLFFTTFMSELKPGLRQSTEESLVDIANLLATLVSAEVQSERIANGRFSAAVDAFQNRRLNAKIWNLKKQHPGLELYITDAQGIVLFDSRDAYRTESTIGADYSRWNDVYLTLRGLYGARSTLADPDDKFSSVMHVAAPILADDRIIGVLTVMKHNTNVRPFLIAAQQNLAKKALSLLVLALMAGLILSIWLSRSVRQLANYAKAVKQGSSVKPPSVSGVELRQLADAMASMKTELEGKQYIETYVQNLTHQLKSPIASIQGAAELISEDMDQAQRQRFIANIIGESQRLQNIVQHLLSLAAIENRDHLQAVETVDLIELNQETIEAQQWAIQQKQLSINSHYQAPIMISGERFLLQQAWTNLLENAIEHTPVQGVIDIAIAATGALIELSITNDGEAIPDFALARIFERFYSLPKTGSSHKGTGLGLCLVKEIARLHHGAIRVFNLTGPRVRAVLSLSV